MPAGLKKTEKLWIRRKKNRKFTEREAISAGAGLKGVFTG
jgi:hypothetical protein